MKKKNFMLLFVWLLFSYSVTAQQSKTGKVSVTIPLSGICYSVINELGTENYYKTSPHSSEELKTGDVIELEFDTNENNLNTIQVKGPEITTPLFCEIISLNENQNSIIEQVSEKPINIKDYVTFNEEHNVLVFKSWRDVSSLQSILDNQIQNYEFNQGNEDKIFEIFELIENNGWNMSSNANGNKVSLPLFKQFLDDSYPLGNKVLIKIIELDENLGLNPNFVRDVFVSNYPLSYNIEQRLLNSSMAPGKLNEIIDGNDNFLGAPHFVYDDFLKIFPSYTSLYEKLDQEELVKLKSGMDPADPNFDSDPVVLPFEKLIMNFKHEVWIEGYLYKIYEDCRAIAFNSNLEQAYEELSVLDTNGSPTIPELSETQAGVSMEIIDSYIPNSYLIYNPEKYDPLGSVNDDPQYNTALQTYNMINGCPVSNFNRSLYLSGDLSVNFYDITNWDEALEDESSYYQYWSFGDGSGSFQDDPIHTYNSYGTYTVRLTTFNVDCGCWHIHTRTIELLEPELRQGNDDCPINQISPSFYGNAIGDNQVRITVTNGSPAEQGTFVTNYIYNFSTEAGSPIGTVESPDYEIIYTLPGADNYVVEVTTIWSGENECISQSNPEPFTIYNTPQPPECCDRKSTYKNNPFEVDYNGDKYKLKINDQVKGSFSNQYNRHMDAYQRLYKKKDGKLFFKKQSAWHSIEVGGTYYYRVWISGSGDVCDDVPFGYLVNHGNCQNEERYDQGSYSPGYQFIDKFGIDEGGVIMLHQVYLGGSFVENPTGIGPYSCTNVGGHLLFNEIIDFGECPD